jgi:hypothetical protein
MKRTLMVISLLLFAIPVYSQAPFKGCAAVGSGAPTAANPTGTLSAPKQALNKLKNRDAAPTTIDPSATVTEIFTSGSDLTRFNSNQGASFVGYVAHVKPGEPKETCNCARADIADIHIDVVANKADKDTSSKYMIVEISPRWQGTGSGKLGDLASVKKALEGHWVEFTGWMMFDYIHKSNAKNTNPTGHAIWRATAWEVHPVTSFKVVAAP